MIKPLRSESVNVRRHGYPAMVGTTIEELHLEHKDPNGRTVRTEFLGIAVELQEKPGLVVYAQPNQLEPAR